MTGAHRDFESLYRAHAGAVRAYAARRIDLATADDVVSDVFLITWRRLHDVPEDALPWLLGVARRVLANKRRGESRAAALRDRLRSQPQHHTTHDAPERDDGVVIALRQLSERDREVLLLSAWEGLDTQQVAVVLGIRPGTAAVRLHRARERFAQLLDDKSEPPDRAEPAKGVEAR